MWTGRAEAARCPGARWRRPDERPASPTALDDLGLDGGRRDDVGRRVSPTEDGGDARQGRSGSRSVRSSHPVHPRAVLAASRSAIPTYTAARPMNRLPHVGQVASATAGVAVLEQQVGLGHVVVNGSRRASRWPPIGRGGNAWTARRSMIIVTSTEAAEHETSLMLTTVNVDHGSESGEDVHDTPDLSARPGPEHAADRDRPSGSAAGTPAPAGEPRRPVHRARLRAVFAGAAGTPLACTIMGVELFGGGLVVTSRRPAWSPTSSRRTVASTAHERVRCPRAMTQSSRHDPRQPTPARRRWLPARVTATTMTMRRGSRTR